MALRIDPDVSQLNRFIRKLESTSNDFARDRSRRLVDNLSEDIVDSMQYPNESDANRPGNKPYYYQRGVGTIRGGQIVYTSGNLQGNWEREISESQNEAIARISNTTIGQHVNGGRRSYSSYVHGIPGAQNIAMRQAFFHTQRQWPSLFLNAQAIAGEEGVTVQNISPSDSAERAAMDIINELERF
jgi:hypothetical protein